MPVRFRCAYCNQLMGISHRKVGSVVRCPKCAGQVVVPEPNDVPDDSSLPSDGPLRPHPGGPEVNRSLEDPELELLLASAAKEASTDTAPPKMKMRRKPSLPPMIEIDVEPIDVPAPAPVPPPRPVSSLESSPSMPPSSAPAIEPPPPGTLSLPRWALAAAAIGVITLMALSFLIGFLLGKQAGS